MPEVTFVGARRSNRSLQSEEDAVVRLCKILKHLQGRAGPWRDSVQVADAIALAESILVLIQYKPKATAEDAMDILDTVEELVDYFYGKIYDIIANHNRRA